VKLYSLLLVCFVPFAALADDMAAMPMQGMYGQYSMSRETSGTSWGPDSTPVEAIHVMRDGWTAMLHGYDDVVYDHQAGARGKVQAFDEGMVMGMASHALEGGTIGFRAMLSPDPFMGPQGYPLLLQTGETANGATPLVDRQHPHDLFMELATTYSHPLTPDSSAFVYFGYPGEPALGPTTFMHRFSGMDDPEAPITHHWLDSTHVTFGVATAGYIWRNWKIEASSFTGREPDQNRWNFDPARFDSQSVRLTFNPTANWSMQVSQGWLTSPEQLSPDVNQRRSTASATYNLPFGDNNWQTTAAWGLDRDEPGNNLNAFLFESAIVLHDTHTFFGRAEWVQKDDLFIGPVALTGQTAEIGKLSAGYIYDVPLMDHVKLGLGGLGSVYAIPAGLTPSYGNNPMSFMLFARVKLD
jgi:hypothetical protein